MGIDIRRVQAYHGLVFHREKMPKKSTTVRLGVIGLGGMGSAHANAVQSGTIPGCELAAVSDQDETRAAQFPGVPFFRDAGDMLASGKVDAVVIATPHFAHTTLGIAALRAGVHVLVEKPISVHKADCERLLAAHTNRRQVFCAMFNVRPEPAYQKLRELVRSGQLGEIRRVNWIITTWFRSEAYYASGGWRATWAGEGGGVLLNQCPHNLDMYQWIFGMPKKVRGFCQIGRYHHIEVEDDVTAYFEHANGQTGVFVTSTGEAPGTNRLEVVGEQGRLTLEDGALRYLRNEIPMTEFSRTTTSRFGAIPHWDVSIPVSQATEFGNISILKNFINAILHGEPLISPAHEGIHSVELANAILYSSLTEKTITLPLDSRTYERKLNELIKKSKFKKKVARVKTDASEFTKSFALTAKR